MTLETMQEVVAELNSRKVDAVLEYPGFIHIGRVCIGDESDTISADVYDSANLNFIGGNEPIETIESSIPSKSEDVKAITDFICYVFITSEEAL